MKITKEHLKTAGIGAALGIAFMSILLILAGLSAENPVKFDYNNEWVAIYPSVARNMALTGFGTKFLAFVLAIVGGIAGVAAAKQLFSTKTKQAIAFIVMGVAALFSWIVIYSPGNYKGDFTHKTIKASTFERERANRGGYDAEFVEFYQEDKAYTDSAKFSN